MSSIRQQFDRTKHDAKYSKENEDIVLSVSESSSISLDNVNKYATETGVFAVGEGYSVNQIGANALPDFPLMGAGRIGSRSWGDNPNQTGSNFDRNLTEMNAMGMTHFSVINGQPSQGSGYRAAILDWLTWSKTNYPDHIRYHYDILQETGDSFSGGKHDILVANAGPVGQTVNPASPVNTNCWYGRDGDGNLEAVFGTNVATNPTTFVQPNTSTGQDRYFGEVYIDSTAFTANYITPYTTAPFDGFFWDVQGYRPIEDTLDYAGTNSDNNAKTNWNDGGFGESVANAYRDGNSRAPKRVNNNYPGEFIQGANATDWNRESTHTNPQAFFNNDGIAACYSEYANLYGMAWAEGQSEEQNVNFAGFCGVQADGTLHTFGTPRIAMNNYLTLMRWTIEPRHVLNQYVVWVSSRVHNLVVGTQITAAAMALQRFGNASTAMDDGYFFCGSLDTLGGGTQYNVTHQWDEQGVINTGTTGLFKGWLGQPLEAALRDKEWTAQAIQPWINSGAEIYKREFEGGFVVVRFDLPGGARNDPITGDFNIPVDDNATDFSGGSIPGNLFTEINGYQDPTINAGRTINETNFPSGYPLRRMDGRFFVRL